MKKVQRLKRYFLQQQDLVLLFLTVVFMFRLIYGIKISKSNFKTSYIIYFIYIQVVIAALIAVCTAGRLDHLERSYLPPDNSIIPSKQSSSRDFGSSFDLGSSFGQHQSNPQNSFPSASNRYLPPTKGALNDATQFIGSVKGEKIILLIKFWKLFAFL